MVRDFATSPSCFINEVGNNPLSIPGLENAANTLFHRYQQSNTIIYNNISATGPLSRSHHCVPGTCSEFIMEAQPLVSVFKVYVTLTIDGDVVTC